MGDITEIRNGERPLVNEGASDLVSLSNELI